MLSASGDNSTHQIQQKGEKPLLHAFEAEATCTMTHAVLQTDIEAGIEWAYTQTMYSKSHFRETNLQAVTLQS